jgi:hypothetical protein
MMHKKLVSWYDACHISYINNAQEYLYVIAWTNIIFLIWVEKNSAKNLEGKD